MVADLRPALHASHAVTASRVILTVTAVVAGASGGVLLFAPDDILRALGGGAAIAAPVAAASALALQLAGGALFGFAMLNWMARGTRVGGIYGRPLAMANLIQWGAGAATWSHLWRHGVPVPWVAVAGAVWLACTIAFAWLACLHDPV